MTSSSSFSYDQDTRDHYKSTKVATDYHEAYTRFTGIGSIRHWLVAARERSLVGRFLDSVRPRTVLDIPVGTGKLAVEFIRRNLRVHAADISPQMLDIARRVYESSKYGNVQFSIADAEHLHGKVPPDCELAVCLRLLHRVPHQLKVSILTSLSRVSPNVIVSMGVSTMYHTLRSQLRKLVLGGRIDYHYETIHAARALLEERFIVKRCAWVLPHLSQEMIFLLTRR